MIKLLWIGLSFVIGALPLSVWIGRLAGQDIRQYGDGNPGATNVLRAAGWLWFIIALMADISKAAVPVGLAYVTFGWHDWLIIPIALAPSLGHTFSPFLKWRGGKALATMLGAWIGLTIWVVPAVALSALLIFVGLIKGEIWALLLTLITTAVFIIFFYSDTQIFWLIIALQILLVIWTHRPGLATRPQWRLWAKHS